MRRIMTAMVVMGVCLLVFLLVCTKPVDNKGNDPPIMLPDDMENLHFLLHPIQGDTMEARPIIIVVRDKDGDTTCIDTVYVGFIDSNWLEFLVSNSDTNWTYNFIVLPSRNIATCEE